MQLNLSVVVVRLSDDTYNAYAYVPWRALTTAMCRKGDSEDSAVATLQAAIEEEAAMNGITEVTVRPLHFQKEARTQYERESDRLLNEATRIGGQTPWSIKQAETAHWMRRCIAMAEALAPLAALLDAYLKGDLNEAQPQGLDNDEAIASHAETPLLCNHGGKVLLRLSDAHRAHATYHGGEVPGRDGPLSSVQFRTALKEIRSLLTMADAEEVRSQISNIIRKLGEL